MKTVIKKQFVQEGDAVVRTEHSDVQPAAPAARSKTAPGVRVVRVDGRVQALEVTCRCGEVAVVDIEYDG